MLRRCFTGHTHRVRRGCRAPMLKEYGAATPTCLNMFRIMLESIFSGLQGVSIALLPFLRAS